MARQSALGSSRTIRLATASFAITAIALATLRFAGLPIARATGESLGLNGRDSLGIGLQDVYRVTLTDDAPPGGLEITISSNSDTCVVARSEYDTGDGSPIVVTVPYRQRKASFVVQSVESPASSTCEISASADDWNPDALSVAMVQAQLRIRELRHNHAPLSPNDKFFVEAGVPSVSGARLRYVQGASRQLSADPVVEVCSDRPDLGTIVDVVGVDNLADGCESSPIYSPFSRTVPGNLQFDSIAGDAEDDITVTASATGFNDGVRIVHVGELAVTVRGPEELGANLQDEYTLRLSNAATTNVDVTISVSDDQDCVVGATEQSLGTSSIVKTVAAKHFRTSFIVQGVAATDPDDPCVVTVSAGTFGSDTIEIDIKQPGLRLRDLGAHHSELGPNDGFFVDLGVPDGAGRGLRFVQSLRRGSAPTDNDELTVTVTSDNKDVGTIVNVVNVDVGDDGAESTDVPLTFSRTVPNNLKFDPVAGDDDPVLVTATATGFVFIDASQKEVFVHGAALQITGSEELGSSLQDNYKVHFVNAGSHAATTVTVTSSTPAVCLVASSAHDTGDTSVELNVDAGQDEVEFFVQAEAGLTEGLCQIEATTPLFAATADHSINVVQGGIEIRDLRHNMNEDSPNDGFFVRVGIPDTNGLRLKRPQALRAGTTVTFEVCSSVIDVGTIVDATNTDNGSDGCESDDIPSTYDHSVPNTVKFDPNDPGTTLVEVTAPGFITMERTGRVEVNVGGDNIQLSLPGRIGSNLQEGASLRLSRGADSPAGTVVNLESLTPTICLVAADEDTVATTTTSVTVAADERTAEFTVAGQPGLDNEVCIVRATASGFLADEDESRIVSPAVQIVGLDRSTGTTAGPRDFTVVIGVPGPGGVGPIQEVRQGGASEAVKVCSSNPAVGYIDGAGMDGCLTLLIPAGQSSATFTFIVTGTAGSTKVKASGGIDATDTVTVHVAQTVVNPAGPSLLGKDLQARYFARVNNDGGVDITVSTSPTTTCVVSLDPTVLGDGMPQAISIPAGERSAPFTVQALNTGTCRITIEGDGIPDSFIDVGVVYSRLRIRGLDSRMSIRDPGDLFYVEIGPARESISDVLTNGQNSHGITRAMARRAGAGPLEVKVCDSPDDRATIHQPGHTPPPMGEICAFASIPELDSQTGQYEFHPEDDGVSEVTAEADGTDVGMTRHFVTIRPNGLTLRGGHDDIGKDLQDTFHAAFGFTPADGTTVTIKVTDGTGDCGVSAGSGDAPDADDDLTIPVPNGSSRADFWIQGLAEGECEVEISSTAVGSTTDSRTLQVVTPGVQIRDLQKAYSIFSAPDPFRVEIGVATASESRLRFTQIVRAGVTIPLKVCSGNEMVGEVIGGIEDGDCSKGEIPGGSDRIDIFKFDPNEPGETEVSVEYDGVDLVFTDRSRVPVKVAAEVIQIRPQDDLALGLQDEYRVFVSRAPEADATVTLAVVDTNKCKVAAGPAGPFGDDVDVIIAAGTVRTSFWVQGRELGMCTIHPSSMDLNGYEASDADIDIVDPTLRIIDLKTSFTTQSNDAPFFVEIGRVGPRGLHLTQVQDAGVGLPDVPIHVCSSNPAAGTLAGDGDMDGCVDVVVAQGTSRTAEGALVFEPVGNDPNNPNTTVCASSPGYHEIARRCRDIHVSSVLPEINGPVLGAGLQDQYTLRLTNALAAAQTFGIEVAPESSGVCTLALDTDDAGAGSIAVQIGDGRSRAQFYVHASEGGPNSCQLIIDAPAGSGVVDGRDAITIVDPIIKIIELDRTQSTQSPDDPFRVVLGAPGPRLRSLAHEQAVSVDEDTVTVTVCSDHPLVGEIDGALGDPPTCKDIFIEPGYSRSEEGDLVFHPRGEDPDTDTTIVSATAPGFLDTILAERPVKVVAVAANIHGPDLGAGLQAQYVLDLSHAVANDVTFTLSRISGMCSLANGAGDNGLMSIQVTVPAGRSRATFYVHAFEPAANTTCSIEIDAPYSSGVTDSDDDIAIVQPGLRIIQLDGAQSSQGPDDPFFVEIGVPGESLRSLRHVQAARVDYTGVPVEVCSSRPLVGAIVDDDAFGCVDITIANGTSRSVLNELRFDPQGLDPLFDVTTVSATSPEFISTTRAYRDVKVSATVANINGPDLGSGLQDLYALRLSHQLDADTAFTLNSLTPALCTLAATETATGVPSIPLTVLAGRSRNTFYVHGIEPNIGICEIEIVPPMGSNIQTQIEEIDVVKGALRIINLDSSQSTQGPDDPFNVQSGIPSESERSLALVQDARCGGPGIPVHVCSSILNVGELVDDDDDGCRDVNIPACSDRTAEDALIFHPVGLNPTEDVTVVTATSADFISTDRATRDVRVAAVVSNIDGPDLGAGLQDRYVLRANRTLANATTFTLSVMPGSLTQCTLANGELDSGSASIMVTIPAGRSRAPFFVHALETADQPCEIEIDAPAGSGVQDGIGTVEIVDPGLRLISLDRAQSSQGPNDEFYVEIGVPQPKLRTLHHVQAARADGVGVQVYVCSSIPEVGAIVGDDADGCIYVTIPPGSYRSEEDDLFFDPIGEDPDDDVTTVSVTNPDFISTDRASIDVRVAPTVVNIDGPALGAGLQDQYTLKLNKALASNTNFTVSVAPASQTVCSLAAGEIGPASTALIVTVPATRSSARFYIRAFENVMDVCQLNIDAPPSSGAQDGVAEIDVVTPGLRLRALDASQSSQGPNDPFNVDVGVPQPSNRSLAYTQQARSDGVGVSVHVCSSRQLVGELLIDDSFGCKYVTVDPGKATTDEGDLFFDPIGQDPTYDTTTVSATSPGFIQTDRGSIDVKVAPVVANVNGPDLGAGLQDRYALVLTNALANATNITLRVAADSLATCSLADDELDTGDDELVVLIGSGRSRATFYVHAFEGVLGVCEIEIDAPAGSGVQDGTAKIDVVEPALRIINLDSSQSTQGKDDPFNVESGTPEQARRGLRNVQAARIDGTGILVKVCSSKILVGTIVGADPDGCKIVPIPPGESRTPDNALIFHPVGQDPTTDVTTVTATSDGFVPIDRSSRDVRVGATVANINGPDLGAGLQDQYVLVTNKALASTTSFTIASANTAVCRVATSATTASQGSINVSILAGRDHKELYVHGVAPGTCTLSITPTGGSIMPGSSDILVVQSALRIADLDSSQASLGKNDPFRVDVGIPTRNLDGLARVQDARSDVAGGIAVSVCSTKQLVGVVVGANGTGCLTVYIPAGASRTSDTALYFDPIGSDPATNTTTVTATAAGLISTERAIRDVRVSSLVANINGPDLGVPLQESYVLALSSAVPSNTNFSITSLDDSICKLAANDNSAGATTLPVTILANRSRVTFWVQGFAPGTCALSVVQTTGTGIAPGYREIDVVAAGLRIVNLDSSRSVQSPDDPFNVEIGIPGSRGRTLDRTQAVRALHAGVPIEVCSSKPLVGKIVGASVSTGCKSTGVSIAARSSRTADPQLAFDALGNDPTTDTTDVTATSPGLVSTDAASKEVRVAGIVTSLAGPDEIGAKLEDQFSVVLSSSVANDTVVRVQSESIAQCLVSSLQAANGATYVDITVPKGRSRADFFLHGIAEGVCELSLIPPPSVGITGSTVFVDVITPALKLVDLVGTTKTGAPDDKFFVKIGLPSANLQDLKREQELRYGQTLTVTVCSNNTNVATIIGAGSDLACKTAPITGNNTKTPDGATGFKLHAGNTNGTATITASAPGFISTDKASKDVQVTVGSMNIEGREFIGAGLQDTFTINFSPRTPSPNLAITVTSLTPSICVVAINEDSAGGTTLPITVPKGRSMQKIAIQGVATGTCSVRVTTSNSNYATSDFDVQVVQPALRLRSLDPTTTGQSANDPFFIDVGVAKDNLTNLRYVQTVRTGTNLSVQACSSNTGAGVIYNNQACLSVTIPGGSSETAKNDLQFDPVYTGGGQVTTTVTASAANHLTTTEGVLEVIVAGSALSFIETNIDRVGAGLMDTFKVQTNGPVGSDKTIVVKSLTPGVCKVSVDENTAATDQTNVVINAGNKTKTFALHGVIPGNCTLKASHAEFADGFGTYDVVEPGLRLYDLDGTRQAGGPDDSFKVHIGLPESGLENLQTTQKVRAGTSGLQVTVCSGDTGVGTIVVNNVPQECHTLTIPAGDYRSPDGYSKFRALFNGVTVVEATGTGMVTTDAGSKDVTVTGFSLSIRDGGTEKVGAGLQAPGFYVERSGSINSTVTVYVYSLNTNLCVLSSSPTTAGGSYLMYTLNPNVTTTPAFYVQGKENVLGACSLYATGGGGYAYESVSVVNPAVRLANLAATMANTAANDLFNVEVGVADTSAANLQAVQNVRGGSAGLVVTVANGNPNAAILTASNSLDQAYSLQTVTVRINANNYTNTAGAMQRLEFDPNNALMATDGTSVSATAPNVISTSAATQPVAVTVGGGGCN